MVNPVEPSPKGEKPFSPQEKSRALPESVTSILKKEPGEAPPFQKALDRLKQ